MNNVLRDYFRIEKSNIVFVRRTKSDGRPNKIGDV